MKSKTILVSSFFLASISACHNNNNNNRWINGNDDPHSTDSVFHGSSYRYYQGAWYPIYNGYINPGMYQGASTQEVSTPGFSPGIRSGGFGSSSHSSSSGE